MKIFFHRHFKRQYRKIPEKIKERFKERLFVFGKNPFGSLLNNHALAGDFKGYRSIDVTGDIRAIYKVLNEESVEFVCIGSHHELYGK